MCSQGIVNAHYSSSESDSDNDNISLGDILNGVLGAVTQTVKPVVNTVNHAVSPLINNLLNLLNGSPHHHISRKVIYRLVHGLPGYKKYYTKKPTYLIKKKNPSVAIYKSDHTTYATPPGYNR